MIYLIGGPPKCGKTSLAKKVSRRLGISYVSSDTLQCVVKPYMREEKHGEAFPTSAQRCGSNDEKYSKYSSGEIIEAYRKQAKTVYDAIDMFCVCEITDGNDYIIEGYHIEPELVQELSEKYTGKITSVFLVKTDEKKFVEDIKKSTTPNDWIITRTENEKTYEKIAKMICEYSEIFKSEAEKYTMECINLDDDFDEKIEKYINNISYE